MPAGGVHEDDGIDDGIDDDNDVEGEGEDEGEDEGEGEGEGEGDNSEEDLLAGLGIGEPLSLTHAVLRACMTSIPR